MSEEYFDYLKTISWRGRLYKKWFLYPLIYKYCAGEILDVGCGIGAFLEFLGRGTGIDVNEHCVNYCRMRGQNVMLMQEDIIPFEDDTFDTIILDNVLEHISHPKKLLNELKRVIRLDGNLIVGVPLEKGYAKDNDHKIFYNKKFLRDTLDEAGFSAVAIFETPVSGLGKYLSSSCLYYVSSRKK